jgi:hypothetical protein
MGTAGIDEDVQLFDDPTEGPPTADDDWTEPVFVQGFCGACDARLIVELDYGPTDSDYVQAFVFKCVGCHRRRAFKSYRVPDDMRNMTDEFVVSVAFDKDWAWNDGTLAHAVSALIERAGKETCALLACGYEEEHLVLMFEDEFGRRAGGSLDTDTGAVTCLVCLVTPS